jgi:dTDP-4-dehydrorhamnose reductase
VHYSTDYVFDGTKSTPYGEDDAPNPLSIYGRTKGEGEVAVGTLCPRHLILRSSWVFGTHGTNFLKTMLRLASERDAVRVVSDQTGTPTAARLIARVTTPVLETLTDGTADHPTAARRPANCRLDSGRPRRTVGVDRPHWTVGVDDLLDALGNATHVG